MKAITLQEMQQLELNLLLEFDNLCKAQNLRYYMDGGTLLGAMCYEGFIPWDDDIDIKMPRPDYERFLGLASELPSHITMEVPSKERCPHLFLKLVDNRTVLLEHERNRTNKSGVYIDVLPMDGHPEDGDEYKQHLKRLKRYNGLFHSSLDGFSTIKHSRNPIQRVKGIVYSCIYSPWRVFCKLNRTAKQYNYDTCSRVGLLIEGDFIRERFEKNWLEPAIELEFEGHRFPAPPGYRRHLEIFYGYHVTKPECYHNLPRYPSAHKYEAYWKE